MIAEGIKIMGSNAVPITPPKRVAPSYGLIKNVPSKATSIALAMMSVKHGFLNEIICIRNTL